MKTSSRSNGQWIACAVAAAVLAAGGFWFFGRSFTPPPPVLAPAPVKTTAPAGGHAAQTAGEIPPAPAPAAADTPAAPPPAADPVAAGQRATAAAPEGPTPEQELHWARTQVFMAEAKESLPVIALRAFNATTASRRSASASAGTTGGSAASATPAGQEAAQAGIETDERGLRDGEIWIRIDPGSSSRYKEIMAQTADLYRANTGFGGEVTVLLWVGGQVMDRQSFAY